MLGGRKVFSLPDAIPAKDTGQKPSYVELRLLSFLSFPLLLWCLWVSVLTLAET